MNRRIAVIIGIVLVILIAILGFVLLSRPSEDPPVQTGQPEIKKIIDEPVISPTVSYDGSALWYFTPEGRLFRITGDGAAKDEYALPPLSGSLTRASWPPTGNDFIAITSSLSGETKKFYDSNKKAYINLPSGIQNFAWMPDGKRIAYVFKAGDGKETLSVANSDGSGFRNIAALGKPGLMVKASSNGKDGLLLPAVPEEVNKIFRVNLDTGELSPVIQEGKNTAAFWLPDGYRFIFTRQVPGEIYPRVFLYSFNSLKSTDLGFNATTDRMVYDKDGRFLYAAVQKRNGSGDMFVKIDLNDFSQEIFYEPEADIKVRNLVLANGTVYFINTSDNKVYFVSK